MGTWRRRMTVVTAASLLLGCAGPRLGGGGYTVRGKGYRVVPPAGWERITSDADLAFRQPVLGAGLMAHATCDGRTPRRPLSVLTRHLRFGLRDVRGLVEAPVEAGGQHGLRSRFTASLDGVPVAVGTLTLQGRACVYDLVVVARPGGLEAVDPDFQRFTQSFALTADLPAAP